MADRKVADMSPSRFAGVDLQPRRPVWDVLSELFLDTDLVEDDYKRIVAALASSPYSIEELEDILRWEVYPVCYTNAFSLAGEWAGFNVDWLESRITRGPSPIARFWTRTLGRRIVWWPSWRKIKHRVAAARAAR